MQQTNRRAFLKLAALAPASACLPRSASAMFAREQPTQFQPVRQKILQALAADRATGISIAVVHRGSIVWAEGFGFADREHRIKATPDTPFCLASMTKSLTATVATALAARRLVDLDAPAMQYLQKTPLQGPNGNPEAVTVRMLGSHNSGLPGTFAAYLANGPFRAPDTATFLREYGRLAYPPGMVYEYGNIGFEALGAVISHAANRPFADVLQNDLLSPLHMRNSFFSIADPRIASAAIGYDEHGKKIPLYTTSTPPSGELYASANDMARFALFYLGKPMEGTTSVLNSRWLHDLLQPVVTGPRGVNTTFGWFSSKLASGETYYFKGGGQPGVATKIFLLPSADLGVIVLSNRTDSMPLVEACCKEIIDSFVSGFSIPEEDAGPGSLPYKPEAAYMGSWRGRLRNGGTDQPVRFTLDAQGNASLALSDQPPQPVVHLSGQAPGLEGTTSGTVDCTGASAFGSRTLVLKLVAAQGQLCGRVIARGTRPGLLLANIPYVLRLQQN